MTITTALCTSFLKELMTATHDFTASTGHAFKLGLIKDAETGTYSAATTAYSDVTGNSDEVANGNGYTTGGVTMTNVTPTTSGTTALTDFSNDAQWTSATFDIDGCFLYNDTAAGDPMVFVYDTGSQSVASGTLTITMPAADASNAIIRIAPA